MRKQHLSLFCLWIASTKAAYGIIMVDSHDPDNKYVETSGAEISKDLLTFLSRDRQQETDCGALGTLHVPRRPGRVRGQDERQENFPICQLRSGQVRAIYQRRPYPR